MVRLAPLLPLLLLCACKQPDAPAAGGAPAAAPAQAAGPGEPRPPAALPEDRQPSYVAPGTAPPPAAGTGAQLRDPAWFRPTLFPGATMVKKGRSPLDDSGYFTSQMTLQLAEGTTRDACEKTLTDAVARDVPALQREEKDDRVTLTGDAAHYTVTLICGEAKGRMTAYVAFRWTSTPS